MRCKQLQQHGEEEDIDENEAELVGVDKTSFHFPELDDNLFTIVKLWNRIEQNRTEHNRTEIKEELLFDRSFHATLEFLARAPTFNF